jgi:hypothetical protein
MKFYIFFIFFKNILLVSNFAKLYYYHHTTWHLGPNDIYDGWRYHSIPTVVWYDVHGSRVQFIFKKL